MINKNKKPDATEAETRASQIRVDLTTAYHHLGLAEDALRNFIERYESSKARQAPGVISYAFADVKRARITIKDVTKRLVRAEWGEER